MSDEENSRREARPVIPWPAGECCVDGERQIYEEMGRHPRRMSLPGHEKEG